jgi:hypothetical protein
MKHQAFGPNCQSGSSLVGIGAVAWYVIGIYTGSYWTKWDDILVEKRPPDHYSRLHYYIQIDEDLHFRHEAL